MALKRKRETKRERKSFNLLLPFEAFVVSLEDLISKYISNAGSLEWNKCDCANWQLSKKKK